MIEYNEVVYEESSNVTSVKAIFHSKRRTSPVAVVVEALIKKHLLIEQPDVELFVTIGNVIGFNGGYTKDRSVMVKLRDGSYVYAIENLYWDRVRRAGKKFSTEKFTLMYYAPRTIHCEGDPHPSFATTMKTYTRYTEMFTDLVERNWQ